jgi:hypothetical protein
MKCYSSKLKLLGLLALTCAMVGVSYLCTTLPGLFPRVVGWIGVGFFGLGFVVIPIMWFRTDAQVIIDEEGIEDRRQGIGVIRWEEIRSLSVGSIEGTRFLCVNLIDPEKYHSRLPRWKRPMVAANRFLGVHGVPIGFSGLSPGIEEVWAYLQARHRGTGLL